MLKLDGINVLNQMRVILLQRGIDLAKVDLESDILRMADIFKMKSIKEKVFLWLCDGHESWILREKNLFIEGTPEYNQMLLFSMSKHDRVVSFMIELCEFENEQLIGNLFSVDLKDLCHRAIDLAIRPDNALLVYENGEKIIWAQSSEITSSLGKFMRFEEQASSPTVLHQLLSDEHRRRLIDMEQLEQERRNAG